MKTIKHILAFVAFTIFVTSWSNDDDPIVINEEEVITTLTITLTPESGNEITLKSVDLDGSDGPNPPVISISDNLSANTTYTGAVKVLNETESPAEDVTIEVMEEGDEHQFFYTFTNSIATTTYTDTDKDGNPIGVEFTLTTAAAGSGNLTVTLRHEPAKSDADVLSGSITNAGGETDIEAVFSLTVQ
jgi:hypothetical protein